MSKFFFNLMSGALDAKFVIQTLFYYYQKCRQIKMRYTINFVNIFLI
jgi:hypothetical protein